MKLNLGCGHNKAPGWVNLDKFAIFEPDVLWDLECFPWPFDDDSAAEILLNHTLEHLGAAPEIFFGVVRELYRVAQDDCRIAINVPHPRSDNFLGDPTHVRPITPQMLTLFSQQKNREWQEMGAPNATLGLQLGVDFEVESVVLRPTPRWLERMQNGELDDDGLYEAAETYLNVIREIRIVWRARKPIK